jgi:hypothetical protein
VPPKGATWKPSDEQAVEIRQMVAERYTIEGIATHFNVHRGTLRAWLRKVGISKPLGPIQLPGHAKKVATERGVEYADSTGLQDFRDAMLADIEQDTKARARIRHKQPKQPTGERHAREVCVFDAHMGKYAWSEETGEDFDSDIARERVRLAVGDLLEQSAPYRCEETILPIGNDLLHTDNVQGTTTMGTPQDRDTRYQLMFRRTRQLISWLIETCAEHTAVRCVIIPGNHDSLSAWTLGEVLAAEYANDPRVTFDGTPRKRKYVQYGKNLIGYAHGHNEPHKRLPEIMAAEVPDLWAATTTREFHLGHFHRSKVTQPIYVEDYAGCTVRVLRSLSGTDAWHSAMGYIGIPKGAECFIWKKSGGLRANLFYTLDKSEAA